MNFNPAKKKIVLLRFYKNFTRYLIIIFYEITLIIIMTSNSLNNNLPKWKLFPYYDSLGVLSCKWALCFTLSPNLQCHEDLFTKPFYNHLMNTNISIHDINANNPEITTERYHITHADHKYIIHQHCIRIPIPPYPCKHIFHLKSIIMDILVSVK